MYKNISSEFSAVHANTGRTFHALLYDGNSEKIPAEVVTMKLASGNSSCEDVSIGNVFSSVVNVDIQYSENILQNFTNGKKIMLYVDLELSDDSSESVPLNTDFKVIASARNGAKLSVTLADKLYDSDILFTCATISPTAKDVVQEICNDLGISGYDADGCNLSSLKISAIPENITCRKMLGYIASYFGKNVYIGRAGKLLFRWYDFTAYQELNDDVIAPPEIGETVTIEAVACAVDGETVITSGSGRALTFENPYMTQTQLNSIKTALCVSYNIANIKHLVGSVLVDAWDTVSYNDCIIPVMGCEMDFDGGVTTTYTACGKSTEEAAAKRVVSTEILIERAKQYSDNAVKQATELLSGAKGGYYIEKTDANGKPYETLWMDADSESAAKHCICINKNGIGFGTKDVKNSWVFEQAWTIDGKLITDFITADELAITGSISNEKTGDANGVLMDMKFKVAADLDLNADGLSNPIKAAGLKAWSEKESISNEAFFTNWGAFFKAGTSDAYKTLFASLLAAGTGFNFYGVKGFYLKGEKDENDKEPYIAGFYDTGFDSNLPFSSSDGFYVNDNPCLTTKTGMQAIIETRISDCDSPTANVGEASVDSFGGSTLNSPFPGSVGYIVSLCAKTSGGFYFVQFGIRYRDNQIKMRVKNKYNSNSDGTNAAWSDWSSNFVFSDTTEKLASDIDAIEDDVSALTKNIAELQTDVDNIENAFSSEFDSSSNTGYEESLSGVITQWGTSLEVSASSPTTVTFPKEYTTTTYGISITPFAQNCDVWYTAPTKTGFKIYSSKDGYVNWMTIGK